MKTAEEWHEQFDSGLPQRAIDIDDIKQIQLDAMKEGARRAAEQVKAQHYSSESSTRHVTLNVAQRAILTAAEQLTEKDLQ